MVVCVCVGWVRRKQGRFIDHGQDPCGTAMRVVVYIVRKTNGNYKVSVKRSGKKKRKMDYFAMKWSVKKFARLAIFFR